MIVGPTHVGVVARSRLLPVDHDDVRVDVQRPGAQSAGIVATPPRLLPHGVQVAFGAVLPTPQVRPPHPAVVQHVLEAALHQSGSFAV
ncbi:MAG: hypothetical protein KKB50_06245 [Planctomycetes bacterium]|nr:hypothetical protein [Planctomycetota bacterium]